MWARIFNFNKVESGPAIARIEVLVDLEQFADVIAHSNEGVKEFQIIPLVTTEAKQDESPCGYVISITRGPELVCVAKLRHFNNHLMAAPND